MEGSGDKISGVSKACDPSALDDRLHFREMRSSDLAEVMRIERVSFSSPWSVRFFQDELRVPYARSLLALMGQRIVGYVIYWCLPKEIDIHNLAVHSDWRRLGIGRSILSMVVEEAKSRQSSRVTLEVRVSNIGAQHLYESLGFLAQSVRKGYYSDDGEDALRMALDLLN